MKAISTLTNEYLENALAEINAGLAAKKVSVKNTIQIENVWLVRVGGEVQVLVQLPGEDLPRLAIKEPIEGPFSHCAHASGIESAPFAEWLADFKSPKRT